MGHEQSEIVPLDMRDQHILAALGEGRRQINHSPILGVRAVAALS
jgi:hypothetical protein